MSVRKHWRKPKGTGGACKSGKLRFVSEKAATEALDLALRSKDPKRMEERVYPCPLCKGWHLTSTPKTRRFGPEPTPDPCPAQHPDGWPCSLPAPHAVHRWVSPDPSLHDVEWTDV